MSLTVYGASDDLIEIDGDITEEFGYADYSESKKGDLLGFSDGTLLRIRFDEDGIWRITPIWRGKHLQGVEQCAAEGDDGGTDRATFGDGVIWVVHGSTFAK